MLLIIYGKLKKNVEYVQVGDFLSTLTKVRSIV